MAGRIIWAKATEQVIWENALTKVDRRRRELDVRQERTPIQMYRDRLRRLADLEAGPGRRRY